MEVRALSADDFAAVSGLLAELGRPEVTPETEEACRAVFAGDLADERADHLVAVSDDGTVVGFCSLHYRPRLNQTTLEAWVPDLVVTESLRGGGAGGALLGEAERLARARGCHQLVLESAYFRTRAHKFYETFGMTDASKAFVKKLTD
jgi:GNAT superfamily N-acetyltransferase